MVWGLALSHFEPLGSSLAYTGLHVYCLQGKDPRMLLAHWLWGSIGQNLFSFQLVGLSFPPQGPSRKLRTLEVGKSLGKCKGRRQLLFQDTHWEPLFPCSAYMPEPFLLGGVSQPGAVASRSRGSPQHAELPAGRMGSVFCSRLLIRGL